MTSLYPDGFFDESYYLSRNADVAAAVASGFVLGSSGPLTGRMHYEGWGAKELRSPNAYFDPYYYEAQNPEVFQAVLAGQFHSAYDHYLQVGAREGRKPAADGDPAGYLAANPDVAAAISLGHVASAFHHFILYGKAEGRSWYNTTPRIDGTDGNDTLIGTAAGETLDGRGGNDTLEGGQGNDTLDGGNGDDRLVGGPGIDRMTGGGGADTFYYQSVNDSPAGSPDVITDFNAAAGDRIHLADLVWPLLTYIGGHNNPFSAGSFTEIRFNDTTKILEIDIDGNGAADMEIKLEGVALGDLNAAAFSGTAGVS